MSARSLGVHVGRKRLDLGEGFLVHLSDRSYRIPAYVQARPRSSEAAAQGALAPMEGPPRAGPADLEHRDPGGVVAGRAGVCGGDGVQLYAVNRDLPTSRLQVG